MIHVLHLPYSKAHSICSAEGNTGYSDKVTYSTVGNKRYSYLTLNPTALEETYTCTVSYSDFHDNLLVSTVSVSTIGERPISWLSYTSTSFRNHLLITIFLLSQCNAKTPLSNVRCPGLNYDRDWKRSNTDMCGVFCSGSHHQLGHYRHTFDLLWRVNFIQRRQVFSF